MRVVTGEQTWAGRKEKQNKTLKPKSILKRTHNGKKTVINMREKKNKIKNKLIRGLENNKTNNM